MLRLLERSIMGFIRSEVLSFFWNLFDFDFLGGNTQRFYITLVVIVILSVVIITTMIANAKLDEEQLTDFDQCFWI